jgi:Cu/Ag efflux protein CusF
MKKILLLAITFLFIGFSCFAKTAAQPEDTDSQSANEDKTFTGTQIFTGKVISISLEDNIEKSKSELAVTNAGGQTMRFTVNTNITTYDKDGNPSTLAAIKEDDRVNIIYSVKNDKNKVQFIRVVE